MKLPLIASGRGPSTTSIFTTRSTLCSTDTCHACMAAGVGPEAAFHAWSLQQESHGRFAGTGQLGEVDFTSQTVPRAGDCSAADGKAPYRRVPARWRILQGMGSGRARGGAISVVRLRGRQSRDCFHDRWCRRAAAGRSALGALRDARRGSERRTSGCLVQQERFAICRPGRKTSRNVGHRAIGGEETDQDFRDLGGERGRLPGSFPMAR